MTKVPCDGFLLRYRPPQQKRHETLLRLRVSRDLRGYEDDCDRLPLARHC